jgi:hypothetical protein
MKNEVKKKMHAANEWCCTKVTESGGIKKKMFTVAPRKQVASMKSQASETSANLCREYQLLARRRSNSNTSAGQKS